jgi:glycosyltransferase involved in cell wall biosynthesis
MKELAEGLRDRGYKITVVTSYPQFNLSGDFEVTNFDEFSVEKGINVLRVKTLPHHNVNFYVRGISQIIMPYIFLLKMKKHLKCKFDIVFVYSPPLTLATVGTMIKKKHKSKFLFNIQDIFPQNAIDLGILKNRLIIKFFEKMEKSSYNNADLVIVHSDGNKLFLKNIKQVPEDKLYTLHNWIDISLFENNSNRISFRTKYKLDNKFIFLFAGVIGPSQGLEFIINIANELKDVKEICFLLVGDGTEKEKLEQMVRNYQLENIIFKPFVSKRDYSALVQDADVGIVSLSNKNKTPVVPGKLQGYMAASVPVVAFLNKESEVHKIIKDAKCGYSEIYGNTEKAVEIIKLIYNEKDKLKQFGENGLKYAIDHFSKDVSINNLVNLFYSRS